VSDRPRFISERSDPARHDVERFDCGEPDLDAWLRTSAASAARARVAQTFVWTSDTGDTNEVLAYYTISAHALPRAQAPSRGGRGVPDPVPAALLGKLALDRRLQGSGLGRWLLLDALERIIVASESGPAVRAIVVDAATERGRTLYARHGFVAVPGHATRMLIRAETVARALGRA
jgi:GNAT superfamily N-acetyltransferase